jgi:Mg/Co/Ni transporter MgtE
MRTRTPHNPETYKQAIVAIMNLIAVKKVRLDEIRNIITKEYRVSNYLGYILKNINVIIIKEGYVFMNPEWTMKLSLNPKQTIDEIYQLCREYSSRLYKEGNEKAKQRKLEAKQRKLEEDKQTELQLQTPPVQNINTFLSQLPMDDIIRFVQSKNYIVLTR